MKETERLRLDAFGVGVIVGKQETIYKATEWLFEHVYDYTNPEDREKVEAFKQAMED